MLLVIEHQAPRILLATTRWRTLLCIARVVFRLYTFVVFSHFDLLFVLGLRGNHAGLRAALRRWEWVGRQLSRARLALGLLLIGDVQIGVGAFGVSAGGAADKRVKEETAYIMTPPGKCTHCVCVVFSRVT